MEEKYFKFLDKLAELGDSARATLNHGSTDFDNPGEVEQIIGEWQTELDKLKKQLNEII